MTSVSKDVEKLELSYILVEVYTLKNNLAVPQNVKHSYQMRQHFHS